MTNAVTALRAKISPLFWSPAAMIVLALALRLVVTGFSYRDLLDPARDHYAFGYEFGRIARSVATGQGFANPYHIPTGPSALVGPAYVYLLAGIFKLFGVYTRASALVALAVNDLLSSFACLPVFLIGRRVFGPAVGASAGWAWALFPYAITGSNVWVWETILTMLLLTCLLLYTLYLESSRSYLAWAGYGLLWALAALTSAATLSTLPFLGLWIVYRQRRTAAIPFGQVAAASLVFLAAVAPWVWRSSRTYGRFVAFRGNLGLEIMVGNSGDTTEPSNWKVLPGEDWNELRDLQRVGEPAFMLEKQRQAKEVVLHNPLRYVGQTLRRVLFAWTDLWYFPPPWNLDQSGLPDVLLYTCISVLAFIGVGRSVRNGIADAVPLLIPLIFFPIVYYLTHQDVRFRHPIDPAVTIFAVYGVLALSKPSLLSQPVQDADVQEAEEQAAEVSFGVRNL